MIRKWMTGVAAGIAALALGSAAGGVAMAATSPGGVAPATSAQQAATMDIVDTAVAAGQFTTLAEALQVAGLVETLKGPGPFTVFAPTDEAFAKIPAATLSALLEDPDQLRAVLTYHVVAGAVTAADVVGLSEATTVNGADIQIAVEGGNVVLNGAATVVTTDVMASNGVIHVIDTVLLPPAQATPAQAAPAQAAPAAPAPAAAAAGMLGPVESQSMAVWALSLLAVIAIAGVGAARFAAARSRR